MSFGTNRKHNRPQQVCRSCVPKTHLVHTLFSKDWLRSLNLEALWPKLDYPRAHTSASSFQKRHEPQFCSDSPDETQLLYLTIDYRAAALQSEQSVARVEHSRRTARGTSGPISTTTTTQLLQQANKPLANCSAALLLVHSACDERDEPCSGAPPLCSHVSSVRRQLRTQEEEDVEGGSRQAGRQVGRGFGEERGE